LGSVAGLYWSFEKDLPTGAAIVCALGIALLVAGVVSKLRSAR
jgi:ABC-type Mn2+/Zn2+ transport system permease subunit